MVPIQFLHDSWVAVFSFIYFSETPGGKFFDAILDAILEAILDAILEAILDAILDATSLCYKSINFQPMNMKLPIQLIFGMQFSNF